MSLTEDDKYRCVFLARLKKIGTNQWKRIGRPEIDTRDNRWPELFRNPQVTKVGATDVEIRILDENAVNLQAPTLLGEYVYASDRCDETLRREFPGEVIIENLSNW
jgi:hypothetical protein